MVSTVDAGAGGFAGGGVGAWREFRCRWPGRFFGVEQVERMSRWPSRSRAVSIGAPSLASSVPWVWRSCCSEMASPAAWRYCATPADFAAGVAQWRADGVLLAAEQRAGAVAAGAWRITSIGGGSPRAIPSVAAGRNTSSYRWTGENGLAVRNPVVMKQVVGRDGQVLSVPVARAKDARRSNAHWLTPRTWRRLVDVGTRPARLLAGPAGCGQPGDRLEEATQHLHVDRGDLAAVVVGEREQRWSRNRSAAPCAGQRGPSCSDC